MIEKFTTPEEEIAVVPPKKEIGVDRLPHVMRAMKFLETNDAGMNDEAFLQVVFLLDHPEVEEDVRVFLAEHKNIELDESLLRSVEEKLSNIELTNEENDFIQTDLEQKQEWQIELSRRVGFASALLGEENAPEEIVLSPTLPKYAERQSGFGIETDEKIWIVAHDLDNAEHEALHTLINPIAEAVVVNPRVASKVQELASCSLINDEGYGDDPGSLLAEEMIRSYQDFFVHQKLPETSETFIQKVQQIPPEELRRAMTENEKVSARCAELGIIDETDFVERAGEYFDRFENNQLRATCFEFWKKFSQNPEADVRQEMGEFLIVNKFNL